jgi:uncharacterized membrane protein
MSNTIKIIAFYLIGFIILYLEPIEIGGLTIGILWKLLLLLFLFFPILYHTLNYKKIDIFILFYILFAFKLLISYSSFDYPKVTFTIFTKALMLPMLYLYFIIKIESRTLLFLAKHFSLLIVVSFLPYIFGLLEPLGEGYQLVAYGLNDSFGLVGVFLNPHTASISLAFAMIVITTNINRENKKRENLFYLLILALGFYELMATYVRTGIVIYMCVLLYLLMRDINIKKIVLLLTLGSFAFAGGVYLYQTNEIVRMRLEDKNKYVEDGGAGSGRLLYWKTAMNNWMNDDLSVIFIGLGEEYANDKMEDSIGERLFAHSEFFQILQQEGLIGFTLFLTTLFSLGFFISQYKNSIYHTTAFAIFLGIIVEMTFQGGFYFNVVFLLSIYLALLKHEERWFNSHH